MDAHSDDEIAIPLSDDDERFNTPKKKPSIPLNQWRPTTRGKDDDLFTARFVAATNGDEDAEEMQRYRIARMATKEAEGAAGGVATMVQPWVTGCGVVFGPSPRPPCTSASSSLTCKGT
ncbi:Os08g0263600 [Oryza sativa Japonica Group]|uniref:Os08g0263600 protein n=1 Tax=Oryza sativa subsp. japonica TaxID=39947 RepID=A0A0P0XDV1_ORYSJ|nr:Os08g0263600 [Oryza sativa Japonica Group]